jgi:hypothetical protein
MRPVPPHRIAHLYREHLANTRRERLFLSSASFFTAFATTRGITHAIRHGLGPFHNVDVHGRHFHHLVFGIAGLLGTGYLWLVQIGTGTGETTEDPVAKLTAVTYGAASAITLDEFALWLNLKDVYWAREGRESVDAVVLFGAALSIGLWGGPFFRALYHEARKEWERAEGLLSEEETSG